MFKYKFPCTGQVEATGFSEFINHELTTNRRNIKLLTQELSNLLQAPYLSLVNSGSSTHLVAAIIVRELQPTRKKVILSAFSFPTTISAFALLGFEIKLVDTEPGGFNMNPQALQLAIDENTAAVCVTHFLGYPAQLEKISSLTNQYGALLVQDACETMNLEADGKLIYQFGDITTHSFYHPHHLSSYGGGAVITTNNKLHKIIESVIHWGRICSCHFNPNECTAPSGINHNFWYERLGINVEMSELNACFARFQLSTWTIQEAKRNLHYHLYLESLSDFPPLIVYPTKQNISPFVFPVTLNQGDFEEITQALMNAGIEIRSLMGGAIHQQPAFMNLAHNDLTNSSEIAGKSFFVGIHQTLETKNITTIAEIMKDIIQQHI